MQSCTIAEGLRPAGGWLPAWRPAARCVYCVETSSIPMRGRQGTMTADHQRRSQLSGYEGVLVRVLVCAGTTVSGHQRPSRQGFLSFLSVTVSLGKPNFKTAQKNLGYASSDAIPIRHLATFGQEFRCQKASESNYFQTTVTRQLHYRPRLTFDRARVLDRF